MDMLINQFDQMRRATENNDAGSSDYDLNPAVLASLPKHRVLRPASVLIPLIQRQNRVWVILTKRAGGLVHHPGQVAFPGGKVEHSDASAKDAALREAEEEIGLRRSNVEIIGQISQHETVTGFCVRPFIGRVLKDFQPDPDAGEVAEVFEVPLDFLLKPDNFQIQSRIWQGSLRSYLTIPYGPHFIWGATARMLKGLSERVNP